MPNEDVAITDKYRLRFPGLTVVAYEVELPDGRWLYEINYDAFATPGQVKKITSFTEKLKLKLPYKLYRIPF